LDSCQGLVYWNGVLVGNLAPANYSVLQFNVAVNAVQGSNNLTIAGAGLSDTYGLLIDNVTLKQQGSTVNLLKNGGF
jgi:hypothetical protein